MRKKTKRSVKPWHWKSLGCNGFRWKTPRCRYRGAGCDVTDGCACFKKQLNYLLAREEQHRFAQHDVNLYEKFLTKARFSFWGPWISSDDDVCCDPDAGDTEASLEDLFFRAGLPSTGWYVESLVEDMIAFYSENRFLARDFDAVREVMTLGVEHLDGLADNAKYLSFLRLMTDAKSLCESLHIVFDEYEPVGLEL